MTRVFRLYGDPLELRDRAENLIFREKGVAEFHVLKKSDGDKPWRMLMRWIPYELRGDAGQPPPDPTTDIYDANARAWFKSNHNKDASIWMTNAKGHGKGEMFVLRGAHLFAQEDPGEDDLVTWWPLVPQADLGHGGEVTRSEVGLGVNWGPGIRFQLQVPTPIAQTELVDGHPRSFFTLGAKFSGMVDSEAQACEVAELLGGPFGVKDSFFSFKKGWHDLPSKQLGRFGFTPTFSYADRNLLWFKDNKYIPSDAKLDEFEVKRFWAPMRPGRLQEALETLQHIGLSVGTNVGTKPGMLQLEEGPDGRQETAINFRPPSAVSSMHDSVLRLRLTVKGSGKEGEAGDIKWTSSLGEPKPQILLRLPNAVGGWLAIGSNELHIEWHVSWTINDGNVWEPQQWRPKCQIRLHWQETFRQQAGQDGSFIDVAGRKERVVYGGTLGSALSIMESGKRGLFRLEPTRPESFMPELRLSAAAVPRFGIWGKPVYLAWEPDAGRLTYPQPPAAGASAALRLSLLAQQDPAFVSDESSPPIEFTAKWPGVMHGSPEPEWKFKVGHDTAWVDGDSKESDVGDRDLSYFASFSCAATATAWQARVSGQQFTAVDVSTVKGTLRSGGIGSSGHRWRHVAVQENFPVPLELKLELMMPFARIEALGVDKGRGDPGREPPLLVPLRESERGQSIKEIPFRLRVTETLSVMADRELAIHVLDAQRDTPPVSAYAVLSREPFSVMRFEHAPLGARGTDENAIVAAYSSTTRIWEFMRVHKTYHYTLPPQSVGESADKPRRMEIHDVIGSDTSDYPGEGTRPPVHRPFRGKPGTHDGRPAKQRRAVEFRLTPSAEVWIEPSDVERGYIMPEWQTYEIFRQHGELGLGAALTAFRAEFLYGLPVGVDVNQERGPARRARVAEVEALIGRPLDKLDGTGDLAHRWNAVRTAIATRPERLEVWADDPEQQQAFAPARFGLGTRFAVRPTALLRAPVSDFDRADTDEPQGESIRYHPQGLAGGALWPVESANLFRALTANPRSTGGELESVAFSPLGGDAKQKALFLDGKVAIISQTRNGFIESQRVEVLGRVGALWHRAKHVVVYERTTNPSAQFAPKFKEDEFRTRSRRPIVRKVREYVEILQPARSYPDFAQATRRTAGVLERVRFNSHIINVDSAWSSDVGADGWKIPLWSRAAARERPQVYPMPDVAFVSFCEGESEDSTVAQECLDGDYLFFYADLKTRSSDTDTWPEVLGIDYANVPSSEAMATHVDHASSKDPIEDEQGQARRRPSVSRILPGMRNFTWRLAPANRKAMINAGRGKKPLYVELDSVSFMRAAPMAKSLEGEGAKEYKELLAWSSNAAEAGAGATKNMKYWSGAGYDAGPLRGQFSELVKKLRNGDAGAATGLQGWWTGNNANLKKEMAEALGAPLGSAADLFNAALPDAPKTAVNHCDELSVRALALIHGKAMLVESLLRDIEASGTLFDSPDLADFEKLVTDLTGRIVEGVRPAFEEASVRIGDVRKGAETVRGIVLDLNAQMDRALEATRVRVLQHVAAYDPAKPWSPARHAEFYAGLSAATASLADELKGEINDARRRASMEADDLAQQVSGVVAASLRDILADEDEALKIFGKGGILGQRMAGATAILDAFDSETSDTKLSAIKQKLPPALHAKFDAMRVAIKPFLDGTRKVSVDAHHAIRQIEVAGAEAAKAIPNVGTGIKQMILDFGAFAGEFTTFITEVAGAGLTDLGRELTEFLGRLKEKIDGAAAAADECLKVVGVPFDYVVESTGKFLDDRINGLRRKLREVEALIDQAANDVEAVLRGAEKALSPQGILISAFQEKVVRAGLRDLLAPLKNAPLDENRVRQLLANLSAELGTRARTLKASALDDINEIKPFCDALFEGAAQVAKFAEEVKQTIDNYLAKQFKVANDAIAALANEADPDKILRLVGQADHAVRRLQNDLVRSAETARAYGERVVDAAASLGQGSVLSQPGKLLRLYSAVTSAPELAALQSDITRLRAGFDELDDLIKTTRASALFNRLGDQLKAIGLKIPFEGLGERIVPANLADLDIGKVFRNFGGARLDKLLKGYRIPSGVDDAISISHQFDPKQGTAWVQIDIDAPMPGRRSLFSVGVCKVDFVGMRLVGRVRFETSAQAEQVTQTGYGRIETDIDMVVAGQSMVRFLEVAFQFTQASGMKVDFDPRNIRPNPALRFVQEYLAWLFPDEVGGMKVVKHNGVPVGLEHEFAMPPMSINFATSGISNICISNTFRLVAFPDFLLANRFCLSSPERPFIFSIFVIGGTGYINVDAQYRPFKSELTVTVEAAAGGSAALGFAFGPFSGQVFITLSVVLTYRKLIGSSGGGLSIGALLVIAGYVNVLSIATVGVCVMLRMTYRDTGQVDAAGSLSVTIRISRFFKVRARANVKYKLRGGRSETQTSASASRTLYTAADPLILEGLAKLQKARA